VERDLSYLTVGELRAALEGLPDDQPVRMSADGSLVYARKIERFTEFERWDGVKFLMLTAGVR
jgi:hypothetical protein